MILSIPMELCDFCKEYHREGDLLDTNRGRLVCEDCATDRCSNCLDGQCEVETRSGEYICSDCYSGMIDDAYEYEIDQ